MVLFGLACNQPSSRPSGQGFLEVDGGQVWYEIYGAGDHVPILTLHGGPGYPSYYLNPLKALAKDRSVILFDQLGCGRSDRLTDTTLMTIDAFVKQTRQLIEYLQLDEFILYGHSWGTMLATEYYQRFPERVKALILGSPCIDLNWWQQDADALLAELPDSIRMSLTFHQENRIPDTAALDRAIDFFYHTFYHRKLPLSDDILIADSVWDITVYDYMWGIEEYAVTGTLRGYDGKDILRQIEIPVLYITGEYDTARPSTVQQYQSITPNARLEIIPEAGHQTLHDQPKVELDIIASFLAELDQ